MNIQKIIILCAITTAYISHTMQKNGINAEMNIDTPSTFYLLQFPRDMCDLIAQFLIFDDIESEQEFIARTKEMIHKPVPQWCYKHLPTKLVDSTNKTTFMLTPDRDPQPPLEAWSSDNTIIALLQMSYANGIDHQPFCIVNNQGLLFRGSLRPEAYTCIAVSRHGTMLATIDKYTKTTPGNRTHRMSYIYKRTLTIKNTDPDAIQAQQEVNIPDNFWPKENCESLIIAFNKQGTDVIIHGVSIFQRHADKNEQYKIVPINIAMTHAPSTEKTLDNYFVQQRVCKNFTQQQLAYCK